MILTDSSKVALDAALDGGGTLGGKLTAFAARTEVGGVSSTSAVDGRVETLKAQAAANPACPFAKNLVAEEIKGIVDSYRPNSPGLKYVVIAGNDDAIPFFRYPDQSLLGQESGYVPPVKSDSASEASLRTDYVLSQDAYGSGTRVSLRTSGFPVPGLAVGRLVETPAEMAGLLDAYTTAGGVVAPTSSLVTGYDFLADAANAVKTELAAGTGRAVDTLITPNGMSPRGPRCPGPPTDLGAEAARQPPRRDLPGRPLQRQQRAGRRLHDQPDHDRSRRVDHRASPTRSCSAPAATRATTSSTPTRSKA